MDMLGDMLSRVRNSTMAKKASCLVQYSKHNIAVLDVLCSEGYITRFEILDFDGKLSIKVYLKYINSKSVIVKISRVSKPGRRVYTSKIANGGRFGISIISTSRGVMSDVEIRRKGLNVGGELLCEVF